MVKHLRQVSTRVHDLVEDIHHSEVDNTARAIATEVIHAFSSLAEIEGGFTLKATTADVVVSELGFSTRTTCVLQKAGITQYG